jgi:hypothetical protein
VKKYGALIGSGNVQALFADTVYRRKSGMEDFREEIPAELDKKPARTLREAAAVMEGTCKKSWFLFFSFCLTMGSCL